VSDDNYGVGTNKKVGNIGLLDINENNYQSFAKTKNAKETAKANIKAYPSTKMDVFKKHITLPNFLKNIIPIENTLEKLRIGIALTEDIYLDSLFLEFNQKGTSISKSQFKANLKLYEIFASDEDMELLFKRYDCNRNGLLG
jgi:hypothetical protein